MFLVGDSIPGVSAKALEKWVQDGGTLVATAGVGRYGSYREANPELSKLVGVESRTVEEKDTFLRPRQELPFIKATASVNGDAFQFPALSARERIKPASDAKVSATFSDDKSPAVITRKVGNGTVHYAAAYPGIAYLWAALQPPMVPDRGVGTHTVPVNFDKGADAFIQSVIIAAAIQPVVTAEPRLIDTRLVKGSDKVYFLPLANFNEKVGQDVKLSVWLPKGIKAGTVTSANRGKLDTKQDGELVTLTVPTLGYGDMIRIDVK